MFTARDATQIGFRLRLVFALALAVLALVWIAGMRPAGATDRPATVTVIVDAVGPARVKLADRSVLIDGASEGVYAVVGAGGPARSIDLISGDAGARPAAIGRFVAGRPFTVVARPGDRLVLASPLTSDGIAILATLDGGVPLFTPRGRPATGNSTARLGLFDIDGTPLPIAARAVSALARLTVH